MTNEEIAPLLKPLLMAAPSYQGGHSEIGYAIAEALRVPFPLTMSSLRGAAIDSGFMPYDLWPWLQGIDEASDHFIEEGSRIMTDEAVLKLARECAASLRPNSHNSALILDGQRDGIDVVQAAIAAIEATNAKAIALVDAERDYRAECEQQAKSRKAKGEARDFESMKIAAVHIASALLGNIHLKSRQ